MHFEASVERHHTRRPSRSRSPLRSSLKRSSSFSNARSSKNYGLPGGYTSSNTYIAPAPAPQAPWPRSATSSYHPTAYAPAPAAQQTYHHYQQQQPQYNYHIPGAYPTADPPRPSTSYLFQNYGSSSSAAPAQAPAPLNLDAYYARPPTPKVAPLDDPEVQSVIEHERDMRLYSEQRHQETLKQQILDMEITKLAQQRDAAREEAAARQRMHNLYIYSQQRAQEQERIIHEQDEIIRRARSSSRRRSRSRGREEHRAAMMRHDEARRATHICGICKRKGHYGAECHGVPPPQMLLDAPPAPRGRRGSRAGSVYSSYTEDERYTEVDWEEDGEGWYSEEEGMYSEVVRGRRSRSVPADQGVLVVYTPSGGAGTVRSSVRHVVA